MIEDKNIFQISIRINMLNNKTLVAICLVLATGFHFIFYFGWYGPSKSIFIWNYIYCLGGSIIAAFLLYID